MSEESHAKANPARSSRRAFLREALITGTLWRTSTALLAIAPTRTWSLTLGSLEARASEVLLKVARHIFPHPSLDDAAYAFVVRDLDKAAADQSVMQMLVDGVAMLDSLGGGDWLASPEKAQAQQIYAIANSQFFETVRSTAVVALYNNELAFAHFGYEGESFSKGGYLSRGFNDLTWLPDPPASASPPAGT